MKQMIKNILCVLKTTSYEYYQRKDDVFEKFDERRKELLEKAHKKQKKFETTFKELAKQLKFSIDYISERDLSTLSPDNYDLIISFGGDGTFLSVAQQYNNSLIMGINSDMELDPSSGSIGALTSVNEFTLAKSLNRLKKGDYAVEQWKQLYAKINGKLLPERAVNDIYFGTLEAYKTTHFEIYWKGEIEAFRGSSGLVFTTGMGSTSWFRNIGGPPFANDLPIYGFAVRDPQLSRQPNFVRGIVDGDEELVVKPLRDTYVLSFDSKDHLYEVKETDELRIGLSEKDSIRVIRFD